MVSGFRVPLLLMTCFISDSLHLFFSPPFSLFPPPNIYSSLICLSQPTSNLSSIALVIITMITFTPPTLSPLKPVLVPRAFNLSVPSSFLNSPTLPPSTFLTRTEFLSRPPLTGVGKQLRPQLFQGLASLSILMGYIFLVWKM